jgi:hypothetical protein
VVAAATVVDGDVAVVDREGELGEDAQRLGGELGRADGVQLRGGRAAGAAS